MKVDPALSAKKGDFRNIEYQTPPKEEEDKGLQRIGKKQTPEQRAGMHTSPQFISRVGLSRKGTSTKLATLVTDFNYYTIGQGLSEVLGRSSAAKDVYESGEASDTGIKAGLDDILDGTMELEYVKREAAFVGLIDKVDDPSLMKEFVDLQEIQWLILTNPNKYPALALNIEAYLAKDSGMNKLSKDIQNSQKRVADLGLAQAKVKGEKFFDLAEVQDSMFGLRNSRVTRVQTEVGFKPDSLVVKWNKIFKLETPMRFRDLLKDLYKTSWGVISGKPIIADLKTDSQKYKAAVQFATELLNSTDMNKTHAATTKAIDKTIERLKKIEKPSVQEAYDLAEYQQYALLQPLALEIAKGEGK